MGNSQNELLSVHKISQAWPGAPENTETIESSRVGEVTCQTSANQRPSPLVEPDVQISRIRLSCKRSPLMRPARLITPPALAAESARRSSLPPAGDSHVGYDAQDAAPGVVACRH